MPRKRKNNQPDINGMSVKMMKRRKPINQDYLIPIEPKTETQQKVFDAYADGKCIYSYGVAGTGKTFVPIYLALKDVLNEDSPYEKVYIVRSLVATRERTMYNFSYGEFSSKISCSARYNAMNVLPVPAAPYPNMFLP